MLIFGHRFITSETLYHITNIEDIIHTPPSSTIILPFSEDNIDIMQHSNANSIDLALWAEDIQAIIFSSAMGAKYIIVSKELAKTAQNIAETYLFDAKIIVTIQEDLEIEEMALLGVDGVIYPSAIVKISS